MSAIGGGPAARVRAAGRRVLAHVIIEPVRDGRLKDHQWPTGLRPLVVIALVLSGVLVALTGLSGVVRGRTTLLFSPPDLSLPNLAVPVLIVTLTFALVLLYLAALHVRPLVRILLLIMLCSIVLRPAALVDFAAYSAPLWIAAVLLVVLAVLRWRTAFAPFEAVLATMIIGGSVGYAVLMINQLYGGYLPQAGFVAFSAMTSSVWILAGPFAALAGATVTQLLASTVTAACAAAGETLGKAARTERWLALGLAVLAAARTAQIVAAARTDDDYRPLGLMLGALPLVVPFLALLLLRRGRGNHRTELDVETGLADWSRWGLLAAGLIIGVAVWPLLLADLSRSAGLGGLADRFSGIDSQSQYEVATPIAIAVVLVVVVRDGRRTGRRSVLLLMVGWLMAIREIYTLTGVLGTTTGAFTAAALIAIVIGVVSGIRATLTLNRAVALASVFVLSGLYEYRNAITEPLTAALALAGGSVGLMVGVVWRLLTENDFSHGDSIRFPRSARVMLILANALLGASGVALLALEGGISETSLQLFDQLGDSQLGFTLVVAVLVLQLSAAIDRSVAQPPRDPEDQPSQPFSVAIRTASARDSAPSLPIAEDR